MLFYDFWTDFMLFLCCRTRIALIRIFFRCQFSMKSDNPVIRNRFFFPLKTGLKFVGKIWNFMLFYAPHRILCLFYEIFSFSHFFMIFYDFMPSGTPVYYLYFLSWSETGILKNNASIRCYIYPLYIQNIRW